MGLKALPPRNSVTYNFWHFVRVFTFVDLHLSELHCPVHNMS